MAPSGETAGERSAGTSAAGEAGRAHRGGGPRDAAVDEAIILATRDRLARDGYSRMTIGDTAAAAGVTRPTLYRRWQNKFDLVVDALDYGFREQGEMYTADLRGLAGRDALAEAVRRLDPAYYNPDAMVLMGNFPGEAGRTPGLLGLFRRRPLVAPGGPARRGHAPLPERGA